MKKNVMLIITMLLSWFVGFVLWWVNTFEAKSVLGSLWQYYQNSSEEIIYVTGVKVWIWTNNPKTALDIDGALKIGDTDATCSSDLVGSIRYHNGLFQVCNGSSWN